MASSIYSTQRADLLGGLASVLTDGKVNVVALSNQARTGMAEFDRATGTCRRIVLPTEERMPQGFTLTAVRGLMDHEMAHAIHTTVNASTSRDALVHELTNILEDVRIEILMGLRYKGAEQNIAEMNRIVMEIARAAWAKEPPRSMLASAMTAIQLRAYQEDLAPVGGFEGGQQILELMPRIEPMIDAAVGAKDTATVERMAIAILNELRKGAREKAQEQGQEQGNGQDETQGPESPEEGPEPSGSNGSGNASEDGDEPTEGPPSPGSDAAQGDGSEGEGTAGNGPQEDATKGQASSNPQAVEAESGAENAPSEGPGEAQAGFDALAEALDAGGSSGVSGLSERLYAALEDVLAEAAREEDQKEAHRLLEADKSGLVNPIYPVSPSMREADVVVDIWKQVDGAKEASYRATVDSLRPQIAALRSRLRQHLLSVGRGRLIQDVEDGTLSTRNLHRFLTTQDSRVFQTTVKGRTRKVAVELMVDCSGSMEGDKIVQARRAAVAMVEALRGLPGVEVEVVGFQARRHIFGQTEAFGRQVSTLTHLLAKPFKHPSAAGIMALDADDHNTDGETLRLVARRLLSMRTDRRIILVISDGKPVGVDGVLNGLPAAEADLRAAVEAVKRAGIEIFAIGVQSQEVAKFYPRYACIRKAEDLTGVVLGEIEQALKLA